MYVVHVEEDVVNMDVAACEEAVGDSESVEVVDDSRDGFQAWEVVNDGNSSQDGEELEAVVDVVCYCTVAVAIAVAAAAV